MANRDQSKSASIGEPLAQQEPENAFEGLLKRIDRLGAANRAVEASEHAHKQSLAELAIVLAKTSKKEAKEALIAEAAKSSDNDYAAKQQLAAMLAFVDASKPSDADYLNNEPKAAAKGSSVAAKRSKSNAADAASEQGEI